MSERAAPFYCPYCGEEDLRPFGELDDPHGQWRCAACRRAFRLRMIGLTRPGSGGHDGSGDQHGSDEAEAQAGKEPTP